MRACVCVMYVCVCSIVFIYCVYTLIVFVYIYILVSICCVAAVYECMDSVHCMSQYYTYKVCIYSVQSSLYVYHATYNCIIHTEIGLSVSAGVISVFK